jgi:hypothetical protein
MVTSRITNIVLNKDRFIVFVEFSNNINEENTFMPDVTADDIKNWVKEREIYYNELEQKEQNLKNELLNQII